VLAVALIALLPVQIVRAAAAQTVVTLPHVPTVVNRGDVATYSGDITPGASGNVIVEWSADGTTGWQSIGSSPISGDPWWQYEVSETIPGSTPLGTRYIRAHYAGGSGFTEAFSETKTQEVRILQGGVSAGGVRPLSGDFILPGTPVEAYGDGSVPVALERWVDGAWVNLAGPKWGPVTASLGALGVGDHKFRVHIETTDLWLGDDKEFTASISKGGTEPTWTGDFTVQAHHTLAAQVGVTTGVPGRSMDAGMTVKDVATDTVIATGNVGMTFTIPSMEAGPHQFLVDYAGNDDYAASSKTFTVTATTDTADADSFSVSPTTFYPYKDGYRDTTSIHGNRLEQLSVLIRIYSSTGKVVHGATLPMADGPYSYAWNGRNSAGTILAAGKYKVVQVLKDAAGTTVISTLYVNLSTKRLSTRTSYITRLGSSVSAAGDGGTGSIVISKTNGYAKLYSRYPDGWVGVGYQFTLPSATIYKSIAFQVYEKGSPSSPGTFIGISNFHTCIYSSTNWNEACFDHWKAIGHSPLTTMWFSTSGSPTDSRYLRTVRGIVSAYSGTHTIYKARVKVVYQVLV
jgi:hypothetical protein